MSMAESGKGRASGKVILFGEHAVVYGVPAIAAGISRGATANTTRAESDSMRINGESIAPGAPLLDALQKLRASLNASPVHLDLALEIPAGAGLGASAAMAVASARALVDLYKLPGTEAEIFAAAQTWEKVFHGNPSGVDVAAAQNNAPIRFTKAAHPEPLLLHRPLRLLIAQAGPPASTKEMVEGVARLRARNPAQFERALEAIGALVENASLLLRSGDLAAVGKLMDLNQMLLAGWMVSSEEIETSCRLARAAGALGAKLTGAGGGGCVIALAGSPDDAETEERSKTILSAWKSAEIPCFPADIAGPPVGVIV